MPAVARVGDLESGSCPIGPSSLAGPLSIAEGAGTVFVNGIPVARTGDPYGGVHVHIPFPHPTHGLSCGKGSGSVFIEGKPVFRKGDPTSCPSVQVDASGNVFAGG
ncbi:MAG: PAAR domain-containing protein [Treponema sp.]|nr:PAAR domain-containing protein [Treponema sp.]